jgi:hypothetical protein
VLLRHSFTRKEAQTSRAEAQLSPLLWHLLLAPAFPPSDAVDARSRISRRRISSPGESVGARPVSNLRKGRQRGQERHPLLPLVVPSPPRNPINIRALSPPRLSLFLLTTNNHHQPRPSAPLFRSTTPIAPLPTYNTSSTPLPLLLNFPRIPDSTNSNNCIHLPKSQVRPFPPASLISLPATPSKHSKRVLPNNFSWNHAPSLPSSGLLPKAIKSPSNPQLELNFPTYSPHHHPSHPGFHRRTSL